MPGLLSGEGVGRSHGLAVGGSLAPLLSLTGLWTDKGPFWICEEVLADHKPGNFQKHKFPGLLQINWGLNLGNLHVFFF